MRITLLTLLTILIGSTYAQQLDLTGTWYGTSSFLKKTSQLKYELVQQGNQIFGFATTNNGQDSIRIRVEGRLKECNPSVKWVRSYLQDWHHVHG